MASTDHKDLAGLQLHEPYHYVQTADPGAVGADKYWLSDVTWILKRRNSTDTGWDIIAAGVDSLLISMLLNKGDLISASAAATPEILAVGTNGYVLVADSSEPSGLKWVAPGSVSIVETDPLSIHTTFVAAKGDIVGASANDTPAILSVGTNGFGLIARSGETTGLKWEKQVFALPFIIDGGGSVITAGIKGDVEFPFACELVSIRLFADIAGDITIDLWKDTYANFPPVVGDTMIVGTKPNLTGVDHDQFTSFGGWVSSTFAAGDVLRLNVDATPATVTRVLVSIVLAKL